MTITDPKKIKEVLARGVVEVIDRDHLEKRMLAGEKLRIKLGIDPTSPDLHIGHGSTIKKLREFQDLGHQIVLIIGDGTALVGDTSDKVTGREQLGQEDIDKNKKKYLEQAGKVLNLNEVEVRHNRDWIVGSCGWFGNRTGIDTNKWIELAGLFTLQQMIERENYAQRIKEGNPVGLHEALYPIMQGYDSVQVKADVEIGGTDQLFNLLAGRKLQKHFRQREQDIVTLSLLAGTDGRKMSKSWGNVIMIDDSPEDKFGKVMRVPDQLIPVYMESATDISMKRVSEVTKAVENVGNKPMELKKELAFAIVELYDGEDSARKAQAHFEKTIQGGELPESIPEVEVETGQMDLRDFFSILVKANLIKSKSEGARLLKEGAIYLDGKSLGEVEKVDFSRDVTVKVGKRRFLNLKIK